MHKFRVHLHEVACTVLPNAIIEAALQHAGHLQPAMTVLKQAGARRDANRAAFAALFAHFAPRVKTWLQRAGTDPGLTEEMAQEVLLTVWRKAAQ